MIDFENHRGSYDLYDAHKGRTPGRFDRVGNPIHFKLSYIQWMYVWLASGQINNRGCRKGQYCMSRVDDLGDYEPGNVFIQLSSQNSSDGRRGKPTIAKGTKRGPRSPEVRAKISAACKGRKSCNKGKVLSEAHRAALSKAMMGKQNALKHVAR